MNIQLETSLYHLEYAILNGSVSIMEFDIYHILKDLDVVSTNRLNKINHMFGDDKVDFTLVELLNGTRIEVSYKKGDKKFGWRYPGIDNFSWIQLIGGHYFIGNVGIAGYQGVQGCNSTKS